MIEELQAKFMAMIEAIEALAPQAVELVLNAVRLTGVSNILYGTLAFICVPFLIKWGKWTYQYRYREDYKEWRDDDTIWMNWVAISVISIVCTVIILSGPLYIWNWVAVFYPEVYLAHEALKELI